MTQHVRIKQLPKLDQPRSKLLAKGAQALSEHELLQVFINSGNSQIPVELLASKVQQLIMANGCMPGVEKLLAIKGLSEAKVSQIAASFELAKRLMISAEQPLLTVADYVRALQDISPKKQEHLICITLDGARRFLAKRTITVGLLDKVLVHPREVFVDAITDRAAAIVVGHNHPSGEYLPSNFDIGFNQQLVAASKIIGIELIDHVIVSTRGHYSFKQEGMI